MAKPAQNDPILYSDWDTIQQIIEEQLGPLQEFSGSPGVFVLGTGYGLAAEDVQSKPYPFTRDIISITSSAQATVTFSSDHYLTQGEVIFFTNFSNAWAGEGILNNFATVIDATVSDRVIVDFNTFSYPAWQLGDTAEAVQYYISANQFNNLRADLSKVVTHITGSPPFDTVFFPGGESTKLPVPVRGDQIYYSVFDPFYEVSTNANKYKYINNESAQLDYPMPASTSATGVWNGLSELEIRIQWPSTDGYDFVQYFNTGGLIKIDMLNITTSDPGNSGGQNNAALNDAWKDFMSDVFPIYMGAKGKTQMGLSGDPRSFSDIGAFDLNGTNTEIFYQEYGTNPYDTSYDDHTIRIQARQVQLQRDMYIKISLSDSSTSNTFANRVDIDRTLQISFIYSTGSVPLTTNPNQYVLTRQTGWT